MRGGLGEQAQHALLRLAQVEFLMVQGERARLDHHGARLADLLAFGRLLGEHAGEHDRGTGDAKQLTLDDEARQEREWHERQQRRAIIQLV